MIRIFLILLLTGCANTSLVTIDRSWHYFDKDGKYNEKNNRGLGLQFKKGNRDYSIIPYNNSEFDDSILFLTTCEGWVTGFALGYEGKRIMPIAGYRIQPFKYLYVTFTPVVAYTSIVVPFK